jgi:hypothetical protein
MITYDANVVVHINESLSSDEIHGLEKDLSDISGIVSACAHERTPHLFVVDYNPQSLKAGALLQHIKGHGLHPSLIGGI